jgi:hypothetical protein
LGESPLERDEGYESEELVEEKLMKLPCENLQMIEIQTKKMFGKEVKKERKACYRSSLSRYDHPAMGNQGELTALQPQRWIGSS